MSAPADPGPRRGVAMLIALVTLVLCALGSLALWHTRAEAVRGDRFRRATERQHGAADSMLSLAVQGVRDRTWQHLAQPGASMSLYVSHATTFERQATMTLLDWQTLLLRGVSHSATGIPGVAARADHRILIPLREAFPLPTAALTGGFPWQVDAGASITQGPLTPAERACRSGQAVDSIRVDTAPHLDASLVTLLDPDTVTAPIKGVFRLIRDRISRPMVVEGMVESVTGLLLGADLQLAGVLVVQGSVQPAGGRLDVTGAVITSDSGGARSVLGNGDRVRYDACAIRHAIARATRPAPAATWTIVGRF